MPRYKNVGGAHLDSESGKVIAKGKTFRSLRDNLHKVFKNKLKLVHSKHSDEDDIIEEEDLEEEEDDTLAPRMLKKNRTKVKDKKALVAGRRSKTKTKVSSRKRKKAIA